MKVQRYRRKLFLTTVKTIQCNKIVPPGKRDEIFSYKHKRNSSRLPGCLAKRASPASIAYKQALRDKNIEGARLIKIQNNKILHIQTV
jgi:hypothetical protein